MLDGRPLSQGVCPSLISRPPSLIFSSVKGTTTKRLICKNTMFTKD